MRGDGKLLSPERRRRAVTVLCERFRVSERRACQLVGFNPNMSERWVDRGCILFSQYYDTVRWIG